MKFFVFIFFFAFSFQPLYAAGTVTPYPLTATDKAVLGRVEQYLSGIKTILSEFTQGAPNGDIANGKFYLQRPGKLRMEYAPPTPVLIVTDGDTLIFYDRELDQISRISLESTLVGFLAREKVTFDSTVIVTHFEHRNNLIRVSLVQQEHPKDGVLTLEFSDKPLELHTMLVTDNAGQQTTVSLNQARFNIALDNALFIFKDPHLGKKRTLKN